MTCKKPKLETLADIVADIRAQNRGLPEDANAPSPLVCDLLRLADRIESAAKRETHWDVHDKDSEPSQFALDATTLAEIGRLRVALKIIEEATRATPDKFTHCIHEVAAKALEEKSI